VCERRIDWARSAMGTHLGTTCATQRSPRISAGKSDPVWSDFIGSTQTDQNCSKMYGIAGGSRLSPETSSKPYCWIAPAIDLNRTRVPMTQSRRLAKGHGRFCRRTCPCTATSSTNDMRTVGQPVMFATTHFPVHLLAEPVCDVQLCVGVLWWRRPGLHVRHDQLHQPYGWRSRDRARELIMSGSILMGSRCLGKMVTLWTMPPLWMIMSSIWMIHQ
jgi:hypothetical protein